jgi:hypothetical protein
MNIPHVDYILEAMRVMDEQRMPRDGRYIKLNEANFRALFGELSTMMYDDIPAKYLDLVICGHLYKAEHDNGETGVMVHGARITINKDLTDLAKRIADIILEGRDRGTLSTVMAAEILALLPPCYGGTFNGMSGLWTKNKPTSPGFYWIWQPETMLGKVARINMVEVQDSYRGLIAWVPYMDYTDPLSYDTWDDAVWMGPVVLPKAPA